MVTSSRKSERVYLLRSANNFYKFGCSHTCVKKRKYAAQSKFKRKFDILASYPTLDCFKAERDFKWWLWGKHLTADDKAFIWDADEKELLIKLRSIADEQ